MPRSSTPTRSRSPPRRSKASKSGGFRWKDKPRRADAEAGEAGDSGGLQRGYRHDRDGYRDRDEQRKERSQSREPHRRRRDDGDKERRVKKGEESSNDLDGIRGGTTTREGAGASEVPSESPSTSTGAGRTIDDDIAAKFGPGASASSHEKYKPAAINTDSPPPRSAAPTPAARRGPTGPMIVVKINDRLGTTSKVPCLASDTVGDFKKMVAMRIGRKPHEIMLKRQSERPFKDFLTLEDYGVSDGVQLDLELDTGD